MKVVHIDSGLGNQMLSYCEYLALKKMNPDEDIYIETIVYDIPECNEVICQWNGYELNQIFGIDAPNVKQLFTEEQWEQIMEDVRKTRFWERNWNYPVCFTEAFERAGLHLRNIRGDFEEPSFKEACEGKMTLRRRFFDTKIGFMTKQLLRHLMRKKLIAAGDKTELIFLKNNEDVFTGQWLALKYKSCGIECIEKEIRETFVFPNIQDEQSIAILGMIQNTNSVAIHARRGDMLAYNRDCYRFGYFVRAVKYIRRHVENPVFIFFCDTESIEWCKENAHIFGLDYKKDKVYFVDWNKGEDSFRDMQLMAQCKHQIVTNSSFGWWGAYLNQNPNKITCSPDCTINTTHYF